MEKLKDLKFSIIVGMSNEYLAEIESQICKKLAHRFMTNEENHNSVDNFLLQEIKNVEIYNAVFSKLKSLDYEIEELGNGIVKIMI
jgi:hypothetical protein